MEKQRQQEIELQEEIDAATKIQKNFKKVFFFTNFKKMEAKEIKKQTREEI